MVDDAEEQERDAAVENGRHTVVRAARLGRPAFSPPRARLALMWHASLAARSTTAPKTAISKSGTLTVMKPATR